MLSLDPSLLLSLFYVLSSGLILLVYWIPQFSSRFLAYGARESRLSSRNADSSDMAKSTWRNQISLALDYVAGIRVPHSWFWHFYLVSVTSSAIWLHQLLCHGPLLRTLEQHKSTTSPSMTVTQTTLCWALMAFQGTRRLYECIRLFKPSASTMWVGHYAIGIAFYIATNVAIWVQGISSLQVNLDVLEGIRIHELDYSTLALMGIFFAASYSQHKHHVYLAGLKKYTLPMDGAFSFLVAPHYTAECLIYFSLALIAAPELHRGKVNTPLICAFMFVMVNLGVSARMTQEWMMMKFDNSDVRRRWRMIPGIW